MDRTSNYGGENKSREHKDNVISLLQCYIDLSLFDANTGEEINISRLNPEDKKKCIACENAIRILCGASEKDLSMSRKEVVENLEDIRDFFQSCHDECLKENPNYQPNELNIETLKAMNEAIKIINDSKGHKKIKGAEHE